MNDRHDKLSESLLEQTAFDWFQRLGYGVEIGPEIACDGTRPERKADAQYADVVLEGRLRTALQDINPRIPPSAIEDAVRKIILTESSSIIENVR